MFPPGSSLDAGEYLLVCESAAVYGSSAAQVVEWTDGRLSDAGDMLVLRSADGMIADYVRYDDRGYWPAAADGGGPSLELGDSGEVNSQAANWHASSHAGGTPGLANSTADD